MRRICLALLVSLLAGFFGCSRQVNYNPVALRWTEGYDLISQGIEGNIKIIK